jgi:hypothetical protein
MTRIGGEEVNDSPTHAHHRYVINFGEMTEEEARKWPDLMRIVEEKAKGTRGSHSTAEWWHFERMRRELYEALHGLKRGLVISRHQPQWSMAFLPTDMVYSEATSVIASEAHSDFAILQSRTHEDWARFFASSMKDDMRYTPSDCFETFPFPANSETALALESAGRAYYEFRADLMIRNNEGLTKTYNRFHDPDERSSDMVKLRELHAAMDRAVLDAYGWTDLKPTCEFLLDYEEDDDDNQEPGTSNQEPSTRRRKKLWRYRWPDEFRDEVLARLLELNRQRAEQERLSGAAAEERPKRPKRSPKKSAGQGQMGMF